MLIVINPYRNINGLYCEENIKSYRKDASDELPPHLYALGNCTKPHVLMNNLQNYFFFIANRIIRRISLDRSQSIILTGKSGSGKTKNAAHLLSYLGKSSLFDQIKRHISATNFIFELFGNAGTCLNGNSSRFSKLTQVLPTIPLFSILKYF